MLINLDVAAELLDIAGACNLFSSQNLKHMLVRTGNGVKVDSEKLEVYRQKKFEEDDLMYTMVLLAEYVMELEGEAYFYDRLGDIDRGHMNMYLKKSKMSLPYAKKVKACFFASHMHRMERGDKKEWIPFEEREPLTKKFIISHYWHRSQTPKEIAEDINVPEGWVWSEICRLGMQKKRHGIGRKRRKDFVTPPGWAEARMDQPHRKEVSRIDPVTLETVKTYPSIAAVRHDGFNRENVRKAIKRCALSKGFLWAYKGWEEPTVRMASKRGDIENRLRQQNAKMPTKEKLHELYVVQKLPVSEIARIIGCSPATVPNYAMKLGLHRRTPPLSKETLRREYIENGLTAAQIGEKYGKTKATIRTYLSQMKIYKKKDADARR